MATAAMRGFRPVFAGLAIHPAALSEIFARIFTQRRFRAAFCGPVPARQKDIL
jgi:hypothetical protein